MATRSEHHHFASRAGRRERQQHTFSSAPLCAACGSAIVPGGASCGVEPDGVHRIGESIRDRDDRIAANERGMGLAEYRYLLGKGSL